MTSIQGKVPTLTQEIRTKADALFDKLSPMVEHLAARWNDEKEYENFNDYVDVMKKKTTDMGFKFVKMTKRPFTTTFIIDLSIGRQIMINIICTSKEIYWKVIGGII